MKILIVFALLRPEALRARGFAGFRKACPSSARAASRRLISIALATEIAAGCFTFMLFATAGLGYGATTNYVDAARPDDSGDGSSWATAKKTIQAAVDLAVAGDTVLVTNGTYDSNGAVTPGYALTNRVCVTNAITISSVNGTNVTIIKGSPASLTGGCGDDAIRCVFFLTNATLIGFTLTNGYTMASGNAVDQAGGGLYLNYAGSVSNCVLAGNMAWTNGGGMYSVSSVTLTNCTLVGNTASNYGGGVYFPNGGTLKDCTLEGNRAKYGGGAHSRANLTLNNCTLARNTASTGGDGGGVYCINGTCTASNCTFAGNAAPRAGGLFLNSSGTLNNCTLSNNTARTGGGVYFYSSASAMNNCTLAGNTALDSGGGVYFGSATFKQKNCLLVGNTAGTNGGGVYCGTGAGTLTNCTVAGNTAGTSGGGVYCLAAGSLVSCIIWGNIAGDNSSSNVYGAGTFTFDHTCSGPAQTGTGNIGSDPLFVDTNSRNYRLTGNSPCINAGTNGNWTTNGVDLDNNMRIRYGIVDLGAYECILNGTIFRGN